MNRSTPGPPLAPRKVLLGGQSRRLHPTRCCLAFVVSFYFPRCLNTPSGRPCTMARIEPALDSFAANCAACGKPKRQHQRPEALLSEHASALIAQSAARLDAAKTTLRAAKGPFLRTQAAPTFETLHECAA